MSRKAMILLLVAILAVHVVLLCLFLATDSAEHQIENTRRELDEENALRSAWDQTQEAASKTAQTAQAVTTPAAGATSQADQPKQTATACALPPPSVRSTRRPETTSSRSESP